MKKRAGQAARVAGEVLHRIWHACLLLVMLAFMAAGALGYGLSRGPVEIPGLASYLATRLSGQGITIRMDKAELNWAGWRDGGSPFRLELGGIMARDGAGLDLAQIPAATLDLPPADLLGGNVPLTVTGAGATLPGASVPVSWHATIWPGAGYSLAGAEFQVSLGAGTLGQGDMKTAITSGAFTLIIAPGEADIPDGRIVLPHVGQSAPGIGFTLAAKRQGGWQGKLTVTADSVRAEDIGAYWPEGALQNTRQWVVNHIIAGTAKDAAFNFYLTAPANLSSLGLADVTGQFTGEDLTLIWLPGVTPLTHLDGIFTMPDDDKAVITSSGAEDAGIAVKRGQMTITGLSEADQTADLALDLAGSVPDVLKLLAQKPIDLLAGAPPVLMHATGNTEGIFTARFPLEKNLLLQDVALHVDTRLHDFAMAAPSVPLGFSGGELRLVTDGETMQVNGEMLFAGQPATLKFAEDFNPPARQQVTLAGAAGAQIWHAFGLDDGIAAVSGIVPFTFSLDGPAQAEQHAEAAADISSARISMPDFAWSKAPGDPGMVTAAFTLKNGAVLRVDSFTVTAPGLAARGMQQNGGFRLAPLQIGRTEATGTITPPGRPGAAWIADFSGPVLDLRPRGGKARQDTAKPPRPPNPAPPWTASLRFATLYLAAAPAPPLQSFIFSGDGSGDAIQHANGSAQGISFSIAPGMQGRHDVSLRAADAGRLLRAFGTYDGVNGGVLALDAAYGGDAPAAGTLLLDNVRLLHAPVAVKLLQGLTLYGVAAALSGPGLQISHADIPFTLGNGVLTLKQARAYSSSLGFTASGAADFADGTLALDTTIVPAYAINALPGRIPIFGHLFSAEKGGGLIAMRAHVSGSMDAPKVSFNPFSALTPGFLRGIFGLRQQQPK